MRDYILELQGRGEVHTVEREVDPKHELAAVTQRFQQVHDGVLKFNRVKGSRFSVVTNVFGDRQRLCQMIGAGDGNFCRRWMEIRDNAHTQIDASCDSDYQEERIVGKPGDLPLITYCELDGGPYFNSAIYLARGPETGIPNLSFHRTMYVNDNEMRSRLGESHDLTYYYNKAEAMGNPLDVAILIGVSPEIFLAACASLRRDESELQAAASIIGQPIQMQSCLSIDLMFPRQTEIVIEGRILPGVKKPEGPFGEFMGYYVPVQDNHVFEVSSVHWRKDALFHSLNCGSPEDMYPLDYLLAARVYAELSAKLPGIVDVACHPYLMNTIIKIKQQYDGHSRQVLLMAIASHIDYNKTCMVVDEDVDIHDLSDVWWAFLTRGRADTRAFTINDMPGFYRDPHKEHWGRLAIDATKPFARREEFSRKKIPGVDEIDLSSYLT